MASTSTTQSPVLGKPRAAAPSADLDPPVDAARGLPRVSVIMPAHNAEATIGRALISLLAQTMPDWEAVIVDDGSTDGTWAEIEAWMARDPRIRGIRLMRNAKAPGASNRAIAAARGQWVAVLDSDDWIAPSRLQTLLDCAEAEGCDIVADNQLLYDQEAGAVIGTVLPITRERHPLSLDQYVARCITGVSRFDHGMLKPMVRRAFLERSGVRYEPECQDGFDFHFMLDLLAAGARAHIVHEPLYVYVQPFGALSRRLSHPARTHYRYDVMRRFTERAITRYHTSLAPSVVRSLRRRSRAISRYATYLEMKDAVGGRDLGRALAAFARNPACVQLAGVAVLTRLGVIRRVFPLPSDHAPAARMPPGHAVAGSRRL